MDVGLVGLSDVATLHLHEDIESISSIGDYNKLISTMGSSYIRDFQNSQHWLPNSPQLRILIFCMQASLFSSNMSGMIPPTRSRQSMAEALLDSIFRQQMGGINR